MIGDDTYIEAQRIEYCSNKEYLKLVRQNNKLAKQMDLLNRKDDEEWDRINEEWIPIARTIKYNGKIFRRIKIKEKIK